MQNFAAGDMVRDVYMDRPGGTVTVVDRDGRESPAGAAPARFWQADAENLAADQREFEALPENSYVRRWARMMGWTR